MHSTGSSWPQPCSWTPHAANAVRAESGAECQSAEEKHFGKIYQLNGKSKSSFQMADLWLMGLLIIAGFYNAGSFSVTTLQQQDCISSLSSSSKGRVFSFYRAIKRTFPLSLLLPTSGDFHRDSSKKHPLEAFISFIAQGLRIPKRGSYCYSY